MAYSGGPLPDLGANFNSGVTAPATDESQVSGAGGPAGDPSSPVPDAPAHTNMWLQFLQNASKGMGGGAGNAPQAVQGHNLSGAANTAPNSTGTNLATGAATGTGAGGALAGCC